MLRLTRQLFSVLFSCLLTLSVLTAGTALADDAKKEQEAQAKTLADEAKSLEDKGQLKDAESKYTAAEAIISTKDGRAGLDRVHKAELKKFQELMAEAKSLYDGGKPSDAIAKLQEAQIFQLFITIWRFVTRSWVIASRLLQRWIRHSERCPRMTRIAIS
jgi:hypothetical protein